MKTCPAISRAPCAADLTSLRPCADHKYAVTAARARQDCPPEATHSHPQLGPDADYCRRDSREPADRSWLNQLLERPLADLGSRVVDVHAVRRKLSQTRRTFRGHLEVDPATALVAERDLHLSELIRKVAVALRVLVGRTGIVHERKCSRVVGVRRRTRA